MLVSREYERASQVAGKGQTGNCAEVSNSPDRLSHIYENKRAGRRIRIAKSAWIGSAMFMKANDIENPNRGRIAFYPKN
jgi:hypothetical protein